MAYTSVKSDSIYKLFVYLAWLFGIYLGVTFMHNLFDSVISLMRPFAFYRMSIVSLLLVAVFPLVFSAVCVALSLRTILVPLAFIKSFFFGFTACFIQRCFGDAGWLARFLLLFSDLFLLFFLLWFIIRNISEDPSSWRMDICFCVFFAVGVVVADYYAVYPLVTLLLK